MNDQGGMRDREFINRCRALRDRRGLHEGLYNDLAQAGDTLVLLALEAVTDDGIRDLNTAYAQRQAVVANLRRP